MLIDTGRQGILGESAFQYRGAALVLRLSKPISEKGPYDYIIDSGRRFWRVNVKSSRCMTRWLMYNVWVGRNRNRGRHGQQAVPYLESESTSSPSISSRKTRSASFQSQNSPDAPTSQAIPPSTPNPAPTPKNKEA